jgi:glycosyltransferase involved in cell wall biosynthesis
MTDEPINHHTREPHRPTYAVIVEGAYDPSVLSKVGYEVRLVRNGPGSVAFTLTLNGQVFGQLPFDNLVKAATRIDPDHAVGTELQIQKLRRETAEARAEMYDWRAKAEQLEEKLRAFQEASKA